MVIDDFKLSDITWMEQSRQHVSEYCSLQSEPKASVDEKRSARVVWKERDEKFDIPAV